LSWNIIIWSTWDRKNINGSVEFFISIDILIKYFIEFRQIGKMLNAREPKIVNGPEILNKYVGEAEANIRKLFAEADEEEKRVSTSIIILTIAQIDFFSLDLIVVYI
jgi:hypothetical protein